MRDEFRERFFTPFLLPITIIAGMLLFGISVSRVLLAVSEIGASIIALLVAGYVLAVAFFIEARRRIPPRTLGVALALAFIGVLAAGAVASAAGMREIGEHGGEAAQAGGGEASVASPGLPEGEVFVAEDIFYAEAPETVPTGDATFVLENQGQVEHNIVVEELGDELVVEVAGGEVATGDVSLEAGEYTYYCSVPGHREAGMEGTLTADDSAQSGDGAEASPEAGTEATSDPTADADAT